jgi:hypothetical protein
VQVNAFDKKFNEIASGRAANPDIRALPTGCKELVGWPKGLRQCGYKLGEHSTVLLVGNTDESNALGIEMISPAPTIAPDQMVLSSIAIIAELAAPEASDTDRAHAVEELFRDMEEAARTPSEPQGICEDLTREWEIEGHYFDGELRISVRRQGGCAPRHW